MEMQQPGQGIRRRAQAMRTLDEPWKALEKQCSISTDPDCRRPANGTGQHLIFHSFLPPVWLQKVTNHLVEKGQRFTIKLSLEI